MSEAFFLATSGPRLHFRNGPDACSPSVLFERACPDLAASQREELLQTLELTLGGKRKRRLPHDFEPGEEVGLSWPAWTPAFAPTLDLSLLEPLSQGEGWRAFEQSAGLLSPFVLREGRLDGNGAGLCRSLYSEGSGIVVVAEDSASLEAWKTELASGALEVRCIACLPVLPWSQGQLCSPEEVGRSCAFQVVEAGEETSVVEFSMRGLSLLDLRQRLAAGGYPVIGDALLGGRLVAGGLQLALTNLRGVSVGGMLEGSLSDIAVESSPSVLGADAIIYPQGKAELEVSQATGAVLGKGHPWIIADERTGDVQRFRPGQALRLREVGSGRELGEALAGGGGRVAARVWCRPDQTDRGQNSPEARVAKALKCREELFASASPSQETSAFRLVHGEADGLPGFFVDRLGAVLRVLITSRAAEGFRERAIEALCRGMEKRLEQPMAVVQVLHLRDDFPGTHRRVEWLRGDFDDLGDLGEDAQEQGASRPGRFAVRERGLSYWVDLGFGEPDRSKPGVGLFTDQRENRERVCRIAAKKGGRWLNLFAHTGAFSVSLLSAGAEEVISVDLSASYLEWLEENLRLNEISLERHRSIRGDGRRVMKRLIEEFKFQGIVLDPPTAAAAGRRFWSVRSEGAALLANALRGLEPGGCVLLCRNDRGGERQLREWVQNVADETGIGLSQVLDAAPSLDYPRSKGFPESQPFAGVLLTKCE